MKITKRKQHEIRLAGVEYPPEEDLILDDYAKSFITEEHGQILVLFDLNNEEGEHQTDIHFHNEKGEVDYISTIYEKDDPDYLLARDIFNLIDQDQAIEIINQVIEERADQG